MGSVSVSVSVSAKGWRAEGCGVSDCVSQACAGGGRWWLVQWP
jgi:hypothetical protein